MIHHPIKILLVEDNPGDVLLLQETLAEITFMDLQWVHVERLTQAMTCLQSEAFDVILLDLVLPDSKGLDTFVQLQAQAPLTPIVVLTGMTDETLAIRSMQAGAQDYLIKGQVSGSDLLLRSIRYAIERKRIEATLQKREQELRTLTENAPDVIARFDTKLRHLYVNAAVESITGLSAQDFLGKTNRELGLPEAQVNQWDDALRQVFSTGEPMSIEFEFPTPNGVRYYQSRCVPEFATDGTVESVLGITRDISDRKQAEQKIQEQAALIDISPDAILVRDLEFQVLVWNKGAEQIYGWPAAAVLGRNSREFLFKSSAQPLDLALQVLLANGEWQGELAKVTQSGQEILVSSHWKLLRNDAGQPQAILTIDRDITEQKQRETQFLRAQRLESLGTLASGIAHDLNNVLTPILTIAQLLPLKLPSLNEQNQEILTLLEGSAKRGAYMVKQILTFARGLEGDRGSLSIGPLLGELAALIERTFPKSITIHHDPVPRDLWLVSANATHLHQVFMNFCVNARDAMPNGGTLSIAAANRMIAETDVWINLDAKGGPYVVITFSDTGTGILPEHLDRIFEPFFTTKAVGEGTGLGLSTVVGIIKSYGGFVTVTSQVGQGTQFQVFLPAVEVTPPAAAAPAKLPQGQGELVLLVDDEASIRETSKMILESYNYRVITANDGVSAIATYAAHQNEISAVLLDIMMPSMDGNTAIQTLQQRYPQIKIIACSGAVTSRSFEQVAVIKAFLPKPFTAADLLTTLQSVIQAV